MSFTQRTYRLDTDLPSVLYLLPKLPRKAYVTFRSLRIAGDISVVVLQNLLTQVASAGNVL